MIKQCLICGKEFETLPKGGARKYCFTCSPSYTKGNNSERAATITSLRHALKIELIKRKGGKCEHCGYCKSPAALEFHHLDPNEKDFDISAKVNSTSIKVEEVFREIEKCALLCSNCHREFHYLEANNHISYKEYLVL